MSKLSIKFEAQRHKRAAGLKGETTPFSDRKCLKLSSLDEETQKDWVVILVDYPDRASNDQSVLEGAPSEADAPLEEGISTEGPSNIDGIGEGAPSGVATAPSLLPRPEDTESNRKRLLDLVLLSTYVPPQESIHPLMGMVPPTRRLLERSSTIGAPLTRQSLRLCICATSILIIFEYQWQLA